MHSHYFCDTGLEIHLKKAIIVNNERVGSIYLSKQDEIGILLISDMTGKGMGRIALELLMRKNTEWIETLDKNHNMLLGTIKKSDLSKISKILNSRKQKKKPKSMRLFGNGNASKKIVSILLKQF